MEKFFDRISGVDDPERSSLLGRGRKKELLIASWQKAKSSKKPLEDKVRNLIYIKEAIAINDYLTFDSLMIPKQKFDEVCLEVAIGLLKEVRETDDYLKSMVLSDILKKMKLHDKVGVTPKEITDLVQTLKEKHDLEKETERGLF